VGASAKLAGSGGALVALCLGGDPQVAALQRACAAHGLHCALVEVAGPGAAEPALVWDGTPAGS